MGLGSGGRAYAITGDNAVRDKVLRLNRLYAETISTDFYKNNRFPAYTYDKLLLALLDSHTYAKDPDAMAILEQTTKTALPCLPGIAIEHDVPWRTDKDPADLSWNWDESYTLSENLFVAYQRGAGRPYYDLGLQYLDDKTWFDPLSRNENVFNGHHAYSYVNSLCSAMMAYMVAGSEKHLLAARNAFAMLQAQSYATGGWGPDEFLRAPDSDDLYASLTDTHHSFETPCGSYAHFKLTRYLLRVTHDSRYGDSMERVMYNTILGAKPLQGKRQKFLLRRLQLLRRPAGLQESPLGLLLGYAAAGCRRLPNQPVSSRTASSLREPLRAFDAAMDGEWNLALADPGE